MVEKLTSKHNHSPSNLRHSSSKWQKYFLYWNETGYSTINVKVESFVLYRKILSADRYGGYKVLMRRPSPSRSLIKVTFNRAMSTES